MYSKGNKTTWTLFLFVLAGIVVGGALGSYLGVYKYFDWLAFGSSFGLSEPFVLDLVVIKISFGLMLNINVASLIGIALAIFIYRRM